MTTHKPSYRPRLEEKHKSIISTIRKMDSIALREANIHLNKCLDLGLFIDHTYKDVIKMLKIHYDEKKIFAFHDKLTEALHEQLDFWKQQNKEIDLKKMLIVVGISLVISIPISCIIYLIF